MQKKRLSFMLAASAIAGFLAMAQAPEAQACAVTQNTIVLNFAAKPGSKTYCKASNSDIEIRKVADALSNQGIVAAKVTAKVEIGSCTFYLITLEEKLHRKFSLSMWSTKYTFARPKTYYGFRLGC